MSEKGKPGGNVKSAKEGAAALGPGDARDVCRSWRRLSIVTRIS